jgi:hypothetical protein
MKVGPESVGYNLCRDAVVFGGNKLTATDIAVRVGLAKGIGEERRLQNIPRMIADSAMAEIHSMVEKAIDQVKVCAFKINVNHCHCPGGSKQFPWGPGTKQEIPLENLGPYLRSPCNFVTVQIFCLAASEQCGV